MEGRSLREDPDAVRARTLLGMFETTDFLRRVLRSVAKVGANDSRGRGRLSPMQKSVLPKRHFDGKDGLPVQDLESRTFCCVWPSKTFKPLSRNDGLVFMTYMALI